jgi:hypothetical protein
MYMYICVLFHIIYTTHQHTPSVVRVRALLLVIIVVVDGDSISSNRNNNCAAVLLRSGRPTARQREL